MLGETVDRRYDTAIAQAKKEEEEEGNGSDGADFPPRSESLHDCTERLLPFLSDELQPAMEKAIARAQAAADADEAAVYEVPTVLVVASENVLRGLVMHMEGLTEAEIPLVDLPYAVPLVYGLDEKLEPMKWPETYRLPTQSVVIDVISSSSCPPILTDQIIWLVLLYLVRYPSRFPALTTGLRKTL